MALTRLRVTIPLHGHESEQLTIHLWSLYPFEYEVTPFTHSCVRARMCVRVCVCMR